MKSTTRRTMGYTLAILLSCSTSALVLAQQSPGTAAFKRLDKNGDSLLDLLFAADPANSAGGQPVAPHRFEDIQRC